MKTFYYEDFLIFMSGVSDFYESTTDYTGRNICKKHRVEHIGKTAYSIAVDSFLYLETKEEKYKKRIKSRTQRVLELQTETPHGWVFAPDKGKRWNMSQHIIDTGACVDMLSLVVERHADLFTLEILNRINEAITLSTDSYLVKMTVEKAPTNQRLWGATGLASAYGLENKEKRKEALVTSLEKSFNEIRVDGSIPYVTDYGSYGMSRTAADITPYYHSRHLSFAWHALGYLPPEYTKRHSDILMKATDFLIAIHCADGKKSMALETKHWYFLSEYEVASNSYDVHAFINSFKLTEKKEYLNFALSSLAMLMEHQSKAGAVEDHWGKGSNFQCPYFWSSHTAWLTRVASDLKQLDGKEFSLPQQPSCLYSDAGLASLTSDKVSVMVRGSKTPAGLSFGPKVGGGTLIYVGFKDGKFKNLINTRKLEASWHIKIRPHLFYVRFSKWSDIKAMIYYALIELRGGYIAGFFERMLATISSSVHFYNHYSSAYTTDVDMLLLKDNELIVKGATLSDADGNKYQGLSLERLYCIEKGVLSVTEKVRGLSSNIKSNLHYTFPQNSVVDEGFKREKSGYYKPNGKGEIIIRYSLC